MPTNSTIAKLKRVHCTAVIFSERRQHFQFHKPKQEMTPRQANMLPLPQRVEHTNTLLKC